MIEITFPDRPNGQLIPAAKRPSQSRLSTGDLPDLILDEGDTIGWSSPNHIRYRRARSVTELVVTPRAIRLLESQPNLVHSLVLYDAIAHLDNTCRRSYESLVRSLRAKISTFILQFCITLPV
ncbi:hypothetical protein FGIG_05788 [Fasciola gigantica]|uniref:Uncharacterized protein n=1 Tax=Fasciola gigantica TaxID=46835 RepID=A0A504Y980_FASGI|nr:hypothetical protein FGIG_05788 [Fasciola gigantica]